VMTACLFRSRISFLRCLRNQIQLYQKLYTRYSEFFPGMYCCVK
jgi:hypothetical protein